MVRVLYLFLLLVVLSPINAFADYQRDTLDIQRSLNEQIQSQLKIPSKKSLKRSLIEIIVLPYR